MKVGFTGTRKGMTKRQITSLGIVLEGILCLDKSSELHHGDCVKSDAVAHEISGPAFRRVVHPPNNDDARAFVQGADEYREEKPYLDRNQDIVSECHILIAAPETTHEEVRSGTWATVRMAREKGMPVIVLEP